MVHTPDIGGPHRNDFSAATHSVVIKSQTFARHFGDFMSRTLLKDLKRGMQIHEILLVDTVNFKQARNGTHFLQLVLRDRSGSIKALKWESSTEEYRLIGQNPFALTTGRIEEYQGSLQVVVDDLVALSPEEANVKPEEFLPQSPFSIDRMMAELRRIIEGIPRPEVRKLTLEVLAREDLDTGLRHAPAGKTMHHAYVGGLLEHVLSLLRLGEMLSHHYPVLDKSLLLSGIFLHDLAKTDELTYVTGFGYSAEGQLVGHIAMVASWIDEAASRVEIDSEIVTELKHIVLSHHGRLEFGSPKLPATAEAIAIHYLDNIDAKLSAYLANFEECRSGLGEDRFGEFSPMFGTRLYFPQRLDSLRPPDTDIPGPPPSPAEVSTSPPPPRERSSNSQDQTGQLPF